MTFTMPILSSLLETLFTLLVAVLLLRAWIFAVRLHPFNPVVQIVLRYTTWLVGPIQRVIRPHGHIDWASLLAAYVCSLIYVVLTLLLLIGALPPANALLPLLAAGLVFWVRSVMSLITWLTILQAILSWVNPLSPIMTVLQVLTAPLLNPIRRILPNTGTIDFSPIVLLVFAQVLQMMLTHVFYSVL